MVKRNKIVLLVTLISVIVTCILFIDKWLTNNNPLSLNISNKGCGIMRLNADGKQHIAQPPQPSSNILFEKYILKKNNFEESDTTCTKDRFNKEILSKDWDMVEKNKKNLFDSMSKNIKTIDLTK